MRKLFPAPRRSAPGAAAAAAARPGGRGGPTLTLPLLSYQYLDYIYFK